MKKWLIGSALLLGSSSVYAQSCPVDVPNPIHIDKGNVSVYEAGKPKLLIDDTIIYLLMANRLILMPCSKKH